MNDLQKRLEIAKKMAVKDQSFNGKVKIIEKMINKSITVTPIDELVYSTQPAYLMTKEEYISMVTPILTEYNKFIRKNIDYLVKSDFYGIFYYTFEEAVADVENGNSKANRFMFGENYRKLNNYDLVIDYWNYNKFGKFGIKTKPEPTPESITKQKSEYIAKLTPFFSEKEIYRLIEKDELKSNKRSVRRAIDKGYYRELFEKGELTEEKLNKIAASVGVTLPKSVFTDKMVFEKDLYKEIDKAIVLKNKVKLEVIAKQMIIDFEPIADEVYKKETKRMLDNINSTLSNKDFIEDTKILGVPYYHYVFESETRVVDRVVNNRVNKIKERRIIGLKPDYLKHINNVVSDYVASLPYALIKSVFTYLIREPKEIASYEMESLKVGLKGYEGLFKFTFIDGSSLLLETNAIGAGGYNIQQYHYRYLTNIVNRVDEKDVTKNTGFVCKSFKTLLNESYEGIFTYEPNELIEIHVNYPKGNIRVDYYRSKNHMLDPIKKDYFHSLYGANFGTQTVEEKFNEIVDSIFDEKIKTLNPTKRYTVEKVIKFGMLFGYKIYDNKENKSTVYDDYQEHEFYKAESKAELMNALENK